jgi:hypothetical protein
VFAVLACKMMELARDVRFEPKLSYVEYLSKIFAGQNFNFDGKY